MQILLSHGYFIKEDIKEQKIMRPYPPLGLLYISAWLKKQEIAHDLVDSTFLLKVELKAKIQYLKPDLIALYTNLMTKVNIIEIIHFIRSQPEMANTVIVLGGPDVRYNDKDYLNNGADILVVGEGEQTMLEIVKTFETIDKPYLGHIKGIVFKDEKGEITKTAERPKLRNIDELPFPNREAISIQKYLDTWKTFHGMNAMSVSTQRGCPYTCRWCSTAVYGQSYRRRSPEKVVDELVYIKEKWNPDSIWFVDDVFTVSHKWLKAFRDEVVKRDAMIPFECITRADRMKPEVIQMLKEAGAFRVWIGAESGSQKIIDAMDRRVDVHHVRDMIRQTRKEGIQAGTFIMLGYPGETEEDIMETIHHLKSSNPDHFTITIAYPIKGTGLFQEVEAIQTKDIDWANSSDRDRDFQRTYSRKYYDYAVRRVVSEVNYHKQSLAKQQWSWEGIKWMGKIWRAKLGMWVYR